MKKQWGLTQKILSGRKKIESRWYKTRYSPWDRIKVGETIYIKNTGEFVSLKAKVKKVLQFSDLTPKRVMQLLSKYGDDLGIQDIPKFFQMFKDKNYCILIFLKNPQKIDSFDIDKTGFGSMAAWISTTSIKKIKKNS
ncbi:hypothetical protein KKA23_01315 [Patescibacteria group bacterium]|nr:hypothetical protein [Patescibacteria group bacterium]